MFNKRPIGDIAHLRNQFKSINYTFEQTYGYVITLIRRGENNNIVSPYCMRNEWSLFVIP